MYLRTETHSTLVEERTAIFSAEPGEALYRYWLEILWDRALPPLVALMLNPSKATHLINDNTVERMFRRAIMLRAGGLIVLNAFAWRETDRLKMLKVAEPVGPANDRFIRKGLAAARDQGGTVIAGWGNEGGHRDRHLEVIELLRSEGIQAFCLAKCANGMPQHPLYLGYDAPLIPWP
ncbi:MAG: DUF1643 domain-containing protein [Rubrivivax sp.]|nr:DUF1643 domain-containing protein [Rubrivivax sp.]MDZ4054369.1 DUF1643 domain-containing protein [Phenylobacterium sp.]